MIEQYWNEMFGEFKKGERQFQIPGFPEQLMSADFDKKNLILPQNRGAKFHLCFFDAYPVEESSIVKVESLCNLPVSSRFWKYQYRHNRESAAFIQRLIPFLVNHHRSHYHFYIEEEGEIKASCLAGKGESLAFLFNLSVKEDCQGRGLAGEMLKGMRGFFYDKKSFYWTRHPWLTLKSEAVYEYLLIDG